MYDNLVFFVGHICQFVMECIHTDHDFITCLLDPTLEWIMVSGDRVILLLKVIVNTKLFIIYVNLLFPHNGQLNQR